VAPFEVQMRTTTVVDGTAGTFFANDGGVLRIVEMTASNVNAAGAFVSTEGSEAATFLSEVDVSASDINVRKENRVKPDWFYSDWCPDLTLLSILLVDRKSLRR
jgi:hypothetical protein